MSLLSKSCRGVYWLLLSLFFYSCQPSEKDAQNHEGANTQSRPPGEVDHAEIIARGKKIGNELIKTLGSELMQAIEQDGLINAIEVCQMKAIPLTASVGHKGGVKVKRTSHKVRNPGNRADELDLKVIETYLSSKVADAPEPVIQIHSSEIRYYQPLLMQDVCVKCHGPSESLDPELTRVLAQRYPNDQAVGFKRGELRGVIRVEFEN